MRWQRYTLCPEIRKYCSQSVDLMRISQNWTELNSQSKSPSIPHPAFVSHYSGPEYKKYQAFDEPSTRELSVIFLVNLFSLHGMKPRILCETRDRSFLT